MYLTARLGYLDAASLEEGDSQDSLSIEHAIQEHGKHCEKMRELLRLAERYR